MKPDFSNYTLATFNQSLLNNSDLCTLQTCPLVLDGYQIAEISYDPNLAANVLFAAIFGVLVAAQIFLSVKSRTWTYLIGMFGGVVLEIIGYVARIQLHSNPFDSGSFIMYLCCLTIAPAFLSASIYLCLSRIIVIYTPRAARMKPQHYTYLFIGFDFISLLLQAAGGAIASVSNTQSTTWVGIHIMVAGVAFQVFSLSVFAILCLDIFLGVRRVQRNAPSGNISHTKYGNEESTPPGSVAADSGPFSPAFASTRNSARHNHFLIALSLATLFIFIRSLFRCAELSQGFAGSLANNEATFMILDGVMIILAVTLLTVYHPGRVWGREGWTGASWKTTKAIEEKLASPAKRGWWRLGRKH